MPSFTVQSEIFFRHIREKTILTMLILVLYAYRELRNCCFKPQKNGPRLFCQFLKSPRELFCILNKDCSAQDMHREPKLVWLEPPWHEYSEYVRKCFLSVNKTATKNIRALKKSLCNEKSFQDS
jgi:hypothetical protein